MSDNAIPDSRVYRHRTCGNETTVNGQSFESVSNPMSSIDRTFCCSCNAMFGISEFEWSDTGETISDYYARYSKNATSTQRFLTSKTFMVLTILLTGIPAAIALFLLLAKNNLFVQLIGIFGGFVVGAFVGMIVYVEVFGKPITRKVCGVKDTRTLK